MDSLSIWHWLIWLVMLIIFSPVIIGFLVMGPQKSVMLRHNSSGLTKKGRYGYCWPYLLFGWLVPVFRGEIGIAALHLLLSLVTLGIFQFVMPYLYNKQYTARLLTAGWALADAPEKVREAQFRLGISAQ